LIIELIKPYITIILMVFKVYLSSINYDSFKKMKKDLTKINIVYLIDSDVVSKNKRKIVKDKNMIVGLHSPFYLTKKKDFELIKEDVNSKRYLLFEAFLPIYLKK